MKIDNPFLSAWGVFWSKTNLFVNGHTFKITCLKGLPLYSTKFRIVNYITSKF